MKAVMKAVIFSFTQKGARLSLRLKQGLQTKGYTADCVTPQQYKVGSDLTTVVGDYYATCSAIIFVGACGIAVRAIASYIKDKTKDPAVVCIDERGTYVIPILAGHIGGANRLARLLAEDIGGQAVITTATDINGLLSVDQWAVNNNLYICDMTAAKKISASLLDGKTVGLVSDFKILGKIPDQLSLKDECEVGICISFNEFKQPFNTTLNLIPKIAYIGLGCRRGTPMELIEEQIYNVLAKNKISIKALAGIATIDIKKQEPGLLALADKYSLPLTFYTSEDLNLLAGKFSRSDFVKKTVGVDNVCERAAVLVSENGQLLSAKTANNGVTTALAIKTWRVNFVD
jgi:cobalt-precorrin 5A hydrolase